MKRFIVLFTAAVVLTGTVAAAHAMPDPGFASIAAATKPKERPLPCDIKAKTVALADKLITCFAKKLGYPAWIPLCIADHESGDDPTEVSGENLGILQYHRSTFAQHWERVKSWARVRWRQHVGPFCARCAVIAGIFWMKHEGTYPWSTAAGCGA